jgi:hypothetical protein
MKRQSRLSMADGETLTQMGRPLQFVDRGDGVVLEGNASAAFADQKLIFAETVTPTVPIAVEYAITPLGRKRISTTRSKHKDAATERSGRKGEPHLICSEVKPTQLRLRLTALARRSLRRGRSREFCCH